jgi:hypothetical protein
VDDLQGWPVSQVLLQQCSSAPLTIRCTFYLQLCFYGSAHFTHWCFSSVSKYSNLTISPKLSGILYQFRISPVTHTIVFFCLFRRALKSLRSAMHDTRVFIPTQLQIIGLEYTLSNNFFHFFIFIVAPCILKIHLLSHTNKCTNHIIYYFKSVLIIDIKIISYFHSSYMFRHIICHHQGALMSLAKITGKTI